MTFPQPEYSRKLLAVIVLIVVAPWLWMFGPVFWNNEVFAFRDAANFYYPLFEWQCSEWGAGRIPLWNPYDNLGSAVLADATSSVLYPGKLVFALPIDFARRFNLYITLHVLLAAAAAYWLARRWQCSIASSAMCAVSYAYGGYTLFQYSNVVYLVGAAWLPAALGFADTMLVHRCWGSATKLGIVLAMITLGGDPQTAYHIGMLAAIHAVLLWRKDRRECEATPLPSPAPTAISPSRVFRWRPALFVASALIGLCLAAVQILPSLEWAGRSERACYDAPRNIYQAAAMFLETPWDDSPSSRWPAIKEGLFKSPRPDMHAAHTYYYSVGPWRWAEMIWPNVSGRMFPIHRRWLSSVPAEGLVWTPSLYFGLLPLIGAIGAWSWRKGTSQDRWAMLMVVLGILASCGWYGLGWVLHELHAAFNGSDASAPSLNQPVGGLNWLFVVLLPGYDYFRYPAKWFVVAALGFSLLGARGIDRLAENDQRSRRVAKWLCVISAVFGILILLLRPYFFQHLGGAAANQLFGPFDVEGSWMDVLCSFSQTAIVAVLFLCVFRFAFVRRIARPQVVMLLITAIDLTLANDWLIATVPARHLTADTNSYGYSGPKKWDQWSAPPLRMKHSSRDKWLPDSWRESSDENRIAQIVDWERRALLHKYHVQRRIAMFDASSTLSPAEFQALSRLINKEFGEQLDPLRTPPPVLTSLGVTALLRTTDQGKNIVATPPIVNANNRGDIINAINTATLPRAWLVYNYQSSETIEGEDFGGAIRESSGASPSIQQIESRMKRFWFESGIREVRNIREQSIVDLPQRDLPPSGPIPRSMNGDCTILGYAPQEIGIRAKLISRGLLVLNDLYDSGWRASIQSQGGPWEKRATLRINGVMRGVFLPPGTTRVRFYYRPASFLMGGACSVLTTILILAKAIAGVGRRAIRRLPKF